MTAQFDNLSITPGTGSTGGSTGVLRGAGSNRCLDVPSASQTDGTQLAIWDCNGGANQQWTQTSTQRAAGVRQQVPGRAEPRHHRRAPACRSGAATAAPTSSGASTPTARSSGVESGLCLDVTGQGTANGTAVQLWTCNGGSNQRWART